MYNDRHGQWVADFAVEHTPAANTQATITQAAAGAGKKNVCRSITATLCGDTTAPAATVITVMLRDGASGGGTIKWRTRLSIPAVAGAMVGVTLPVRIPGSANTAMTLEFSAAGGANTLQSVAMSGDVIAEV